MESILIFHFFNYKTMKIRAHHLLCMQGFQGYGYSDEFSQNMSEIIHHLKSNPQQKIKIIGKNDVICSGCPHNKNEKCKNITFNWMIKKMDKRVLKKLGIDNDTEISVSKVISLTKKIFKTHKDIQSICGNCNWKEKCLWYTSRSR